MVIIRVCANRPDSSAKAGHAITNLWQGNKCGLAEVKPTVFGGMKIAVTGCMHGELEQVYKILRDLEATTPGLQIDLVICTGDFQSMRNEEDLSAMKCPDKYLNMGTFHKYYNGELIAPYLTVFVGGNHEASNYLWELSAAIHTPEKLAPPFPCRYYGGWVCPNIYFMGQSGVVWYKGLRIAGISGIFNGGDFQKSLLLPHFHLFSAPLYRFGCMTLGIHTFSCRDCTYPSTHRPRRQSVRVPHARLRRRQTAQGNTSCRRRHLARLACQCPQTRQHGGALAVQARLPRRGLGARGPWRMFSRIMHRTSFVPIPRGRPTIHQPLHFLLILPIPPLSPPFPTGACSSARRSHFALRACA